MASIPKNRVLLLLLLLLSVTLSLVAADPAPRTGHLRKRRSHPEDHYKTDLDHCNDELGRLYDEIHAFSSRGAVPPPSSVNGSSTAEEAMRNKAVAVHVLEAIRRARVGGNHADICWEVSAVLSAEMLPAESVKLREARLEADQKNRAIRERVNRKTRGAGVDPEPTKFNAFEYVLHGPLDYFECTDCKCMLERQQNIGLIHRGMSGTRLNSQLFADGTVVIAKDEDIGAGSFDLYWFYFAQTGSVRRIEHYRTASIASRTPK